LESARVGVNVLADTEQDCNDLARMVSALLWASAGTGTVKRVDITSGPTTIPDDRPHKYLTADIVQKGVSS
jgi:hypothetical protein